MSKKDRSNIPTRFPWLERRVQPFVTFLFSYLLVLLIPTTVAIALSFVTLNRIEESDKRAHEMIYVSLLNDLNMKVSQAHSLNNQVQNILHNSSYHLEDERDYFYEYKLRSDLNQIMVGVQSVSNLYIYLPRFDIILSPAGGRSSEAFVTSQYGDVYDEWLTLMENSRNVLDTATMPMNDGGANKRLLLYQSLGKVMLENGELTSAAIVIELNVDHFAKVFDRSTLDGGSGYALLHDETVIRSSFGPEIVPEILTATASIRQSKEATGNIDIAGHEYLGFWGQVEYSQFALLSMADLDMPLGWKQLTKLVTATLVINLLASLVISIILAKRKSRPMVRVAELLAENIIGETDLKSLDAHRQGPYLATDDLVANYISQVKDYQAKVNYSAATVRDLYLEKLVKGEIHNSNEDILTVFALYGIKLNFAACRLAYIIPAVKDDELASDMWESQDIAATWHTELNNLLLTFRRSNVITYIFPDLQGTAYLLLYSELEAARDGQTGENIRVLLADLNRLLARDYGISFTTMISDPVDAPSAFASAYTKLLTRKIEITAALQAGEEDSDEYSDLVVNCRKIIEANFADMNLNVEYLADELSVSQPYLSRLFKQETGTGLLDYIHAYRIDAAKNYFRRDPNSLIKDVAAKCGFINAASFIRVFKKVDGDTPGQFRNSLLDL